MAPMATTLPAAVKLSACSRYHNSAKWTLARRWDSSQVDAASAAAPGPGKYIPSLSDRPRCPAFGFGSTARFKDASKPSPGPGSHAPVNPKSTISLKSSFSKSERMEKTKQSLGPEPGAYMNATNSNAFAMNKGRSMAGRHYPKKEVTPGPGAYMPQPKIAQKGGIAKIDSGPPRDPFRGKLKTPGPGKYESHVDFGRPCPMASVRSCPAFSMQSSRRPEPRADIGGPVLTYYSSIG